MCVDSSRWLNLSSVADYDSSCQTSTVIPNRIRYQVCLKSFPVLYCIVLYIVYCTVHTGMYCSVLYCNVVYCTVVHCSVAYCAVLYCPVL